MRATAWAVAGAVLAPLLAACVTAYQPLGATGGYEDKQLDNDTYQVAFYGNGNTPRPVVLKYFLHRCAELTLEKGYEYFEIFSTKGDVPQSRAPDQPYVQVRRTYTPPTITYMPGTTITRWSVSGIVRMYPKDLLIDAKELFSAREVIGLLGSEVRSGNPTAVIPARLRRAEGKFPVAPSSMRREQAPPPPPASGGPVHLDDLKDLMKK
jgi:hypothetical protein